MNAENRKYQYRLIDCGTLKARLDNQEPFHLWNVLSGSYYRAEANIAGSEWVPVETITAQLAADKVHSKTDAIVVYCASATSPSSRQAAQKLAAMGYRDVYVFEGGLQDWTSAGYPTVRL